MLVAPSQPIFAKAEKPRSGTRKNYMIPLEINKRLLIKSDKTTLLLCCHFCHINK